MQVSLITKKINLHLPNQQSSYIEITKTNKQTYAYFSEMLKKN